MADTMESMESTRPDIAPDGLARNIAVVGLSISQAADELQAAAERLMAAEEQAREAETRARVAEDQLAQGATTNAELLELLQTARENQTEADERSRRAEQRVQIAIERARLLEEQMGELEGRLVEAEAKPQVTVILDEERTELQEAIAAEVRRPLTSILGLTLALKHADTRTADGREMVKQLATNARKLDRLVGEMLNLDRIASGTFVPNLRRTDLEALVRRVVEESPDLANRDVRVETEHVAIEVDPALTEQMVETLLANAGRRTVPGSTVWVKVSSDPNGVVIAVDDTGPEVPPGLRQAMFAAAQDGGPVAQKDKRARGATGLSLLSRLADIHDGRAWVEERPGGGASFRVFLAATAQEPREVPQEERAAAPAAEPFPEDRSFPVNGSVSVAAFSEDPEVADRAAILAAALASADREEEVEVMRYSGPDSPLVATLRELGLVGDDSVTI
jgi:K+-sensing histidine kinase KdpD